MKIPVFLSCPTLLNDQQIASKAMILKQFELFGLEPRSVGVSDFATQFPLREVYVLGRHCSGGVILGFEQFHASQGGIRKRGTKQPKEITEPVSFPTEWNNLEAGILFSLGLPLLVFNEKGISGGIFDKGVSDVFLYDIPAEWEDEDVTQLSAVFLKWQAKVRQYYYFYDH